jgi:serine/threonine protein kinase
MRTRLSDRALLPTLSREAAETLAAELVDEMIALWRQGGRPLPEELLARHSELRQHPEAAADLIYEELCLRQEFGAEIPEEEILNRFPQWRPQLEVMFDCRRAMSQRQATRRFPGAGESLGDFLLLAELHGGAHGRVFLAGESSLGNRAVVLKLIPCEAREHLSLARLQHTHIVPLYSVRDYPDVGLRALCMPYFGGATLDRLLVAMGPVPVARRAGRDLLDALEWLQAAEPLAGSALGPARQILAVSSYADAVCRIGACLADALQYAHERGLVHLDLKPSNVLLAADGQPMLLDFHLARAPVNPDAEAPPWLGGTAGYMSPEQRLAVLAVQHSRKVPTPLDGRSDVYSLGVVLYEALAGSPPEPGKRPRPLYRCNPGVSVGLADVVARCLTSDPAGRYARAADVAADLRRHLAGFPLAGVRNRSLTERWRKWRIRRPYGLALAGMTLAVLTSACAVAAGVAGHFVAGIEQARAALSDGRAQMERGEREAAVRTLGRGISTIRAIPFQGDLAAELERELVRAERARAEADRTAAADELHRLVTRVRSIYDWNLPSAERLSELERSCRTLWEQRGRFTASVGSPESGQLQHSVREDLLDLSIIEAELLMLVASPAQGARARREAAAVLDEAEVLLGPSPLLDAERGALGKRTWPSRNSSGSAEGRKGSAREQTAPAPAARRR